jgi:hypothetical protein
MMRGPMSVPLAISCTPLLQRGPITGHVAHASDAVGDVKRQHVAPARHDGVDVHVPQAGDEELAASVDDARTPGGRRSWRPDLQRLCDCRERRRFDQDEAQRCVRQ